MFKKLKNYFFVFGFKQTILKLFRYLKDIIHTDKSGVYTPTKKEKKYMLYKEQQVYIFANDAFLPNGADFASSCATAFNMLGCAVNYFCLCDEFKKVKNPPLCSYKKYIDIDGLENINFKNSIVVLDTTDKIKELIIEKAERENGFVVFHDGREKDNIADFCADVLNLLYGRGTCSDRFFKNISIVILNYNNKNVIFNCLDTLMKYSQKYGYEIIVVDNQSTDGSYEEIEENYENIKLYRNSKNGCSSGRNIGIEKALNDYVIFLDSDQWILHKNWLDVYLQIFEKNRNVGALGWTGGWFNKKGYSFHTVNNFLYKYMPPKVLCRRDVGYLGTGGMMVERKLLNAIGGFDINYDPTCYEDTDISLKIRNYGKEIYYCPYLGVGHLPHQTTNSGSGAHEKLIKEKGTYFVSKWKRINPKLLNYIK